MSRVTVQTCLLDQPYMSNEKVSPGDRHWEGKNADLKSRSCRGVCAEGWIGQCRVKWECGKPSYTARGKVPPRNYTHTFHGA